MDRKNKTDQFFREKLDQVEFQPSDQAWKMVQGNISSKQTIPWVNYFSIAASLALLIALGFLFYPNKDQRVITIDNITSPAPLELVIINVTVDSHSNQAVKKVTTQKAETTGTEIQQPADLVPQQRVVIELASIERVDISNEVIAKENPVLNRPGEKPAVTITYYTARSAEVIQSELDSGKVNLFDKMKFFAKNVSPVELITDLRSAKEELIESSFNRN